MASVAYNIEDFESFLLVLQNSLGVVVPDEQRASLVERLQPLMSAHQLDSMAALAATIDSGQAEQVKMELLDVLSVGQEKWDLEAELINTLHGYVFGELPDNARIWVLGCGQGQTAYSLAMEAADYEYAAGVEKKFQFVATDVSAENIKVATTAVYSSQVLDGLSEEHKKLYSVPDADSGGIKIKDKVRQLISFRQCDLDAELESIGPVDLIVCLEVLAFFPNDIKAGLLRRLSEQLKPAGILLAGNNQTIISSGNGLERVEHPAGIFFRHMSQSES